MSTADNWLITTKTSAALNLVASLGFTEHDFAALAVACADQAGMSVKDQADLIAKLVSVTAHPCSMCHSHAAPDSLTRTSCDDDVALAAARGRAMDKRIADREDRGDAMRDEWRDGGAR